MFQVAQILVPNHKRRSGIKMDFAGSDNVVSLNRVNEHNGGTTHDGPSTGYMFTTAQHYTPAIIKNENTKNHHKNFNFRTITENTCLF